MFDVVGIGLNAIDYLVALPRFPVPGEKLQEGTEELLPLCDHIVAAGHFAGLLIPGTSAEDGIEEIRFTPK